MFDIDPFGKEKVLLFESGSGPCLVGLLHDLRHFHYYEPVFGDHSNCVP